MTTETQKLGKGRKFLIVLTLLIVLIVFAAIVGLQKIGAMKKAEAAANMPEAVSEVTAMQVTTQEWTPTISAVGYIRPNQGAMLSAETSGVVSRVLVTSGQRVKKGDLLVEFD
ncbi:TPA: biotin/lipoyl-binding protein, partial [Mannheimia haemolytica]|nr:biotin/lipoyl-binding protein [Mannheimia haemolytica]